MKIISINIQIQENSQEIFKREMVRKIFKKYFQEVFENIQKVFFLTRRNLLHKCKSEAQDYLIKKI